MEHITDLSVYLGAQSVDEFARVLLGAIQLLGHYPNWCQGAPAVSADGRRVKPGSPEAVAWGIDGAIGKLSNPIGLIPPNYIWYLDQLVLEKTGRDDGIGWFNDTFDHATIIDFLAEAYRRLPCA